MKKREFFIADQILIFNGERLVNDKKINNYDIADGSQLHLVLNLQ